MKRVFYLATALAAVGFTSCNKDDNHDFYNDKQNLELRAASLGYSDVNAYKTSVAEQCAAGNHENCDVLNDGTHQACAYQDHSGKKHDGSNHNGSDHGSHDANGHSHGNHNKGRH